MQENQNNKAQKIALQLNKTGLTYLSNQQGASGAFDYFKKAQKLLLAEIQIDSKNKKIQSLLAVTYNNLAIYYKRTNKAKVALTYLKKALQIQTFILEDIMAAATTHLNICAIYSFMGKHQQAVQHANLSIQNAQRAKLTQEQKNKTNGQKDPNIEKSCNNIELASLYNLAVQYQHLKRYQQAVETYKKSKSNSIVLGRKNIQTNSQQGINRVNAQMAKNKKRLIELLQKKKQNEQKGNYESMRRNKKNYKPIISAHLNQNQNQGENEKSSKIEKYSIYNDTDLKKRTNSVSKIIKLHPIRSRSTQAIKRLKPQNSGRELKKSSNNTNNDNKTRRQA